VYVRVCTYVYVGIVVCTTNVCVYECVRVCTQV
jgi:hypothetical protein